MIVRRSAGSDLVHDRPFYPRGVARRFLNERGRTAAVKLLDGLRSAYFSRVDNATLADWLAWELERGRLIFTGDMGAAAEEEAVTEDPEVWIPVQIGPRKSRVLIDIAEQLADRQALRVALMEDAARIIDAIMASPEGDERLKAVIADTGQGGPTATEAALRQTAMTLLYRRAFRVFEERRTGGSAGAQTKEKEDKPAPRPPPPPRPAANDHWIAIELKDEDGDPVAGAAYEITLPDGQVNSGKLDDKGKARVDGIKPGYCQISFPEIDAREWKLG